MTIHSFNFWCTYRQTTFLLTFQLLLFCSVLFGLFIKNFFAFLCNLCQIKKHIIQASNCHVKLLLRKIVWVLTTLTKSNVCFTCVCNLITKV